MVDIQKEKKRISDLWDEASSTIVLEKQTEPVSGPRGEFPKGSFRDTQVFSLEHFRCRADFSQKSPILVFLYSAGNTYFTDGESRAYEILLLHTPLDPKGGWYCDPLSIHGPIPSVYLKEISNVLEFLEKNQNLIG